MVDSDRGSGGSGRDVVGGRRVRTDCDRMGSSAAAPEESVVAIGGVEKTRVVVVVLRYSSGPSVAKGISQGDGAGLAVGRSEC